jgi:predicted nucleic acid-binding protein
MPETLVIVNNITTALSLPGKLSRITATTLWHDYSTASSSARTRNYSKLQGVDVPEVNSIEWIQIRPVASATIIPAVIDLGQGEAEVIALGLENPGSLLVFDDRLAQRIADLYRLKYTGTLGVLVKAKQSGYLSTVAPVINMLRSKGMWLTDKIISDVLRLSGE